MHGTVPHNKEFSSQNVNNSKIEKPCLNLTARLTTPGVNAIYQPVIYFITLKETSQDRCDVGIKMGWYQNPT